jgi:hypothetical protein
MLMTPAVRNVLSGARAWWAEMYVSPISVSQPDGTVMQNPDEPTTLTGEASGASGPAEHPTSTSVALTRRVRTYRIV